MNNEKSVFLRCDDGAEVVVFNRYDWDHLKETNYEIDLEDAYCGGDYMGIKGKFKRAWRAFWAKPITYTSVYCQDGERMKKFLKDCLDLMEE